MNYFLDELFLNAYFYMRVNSESQIPLRKTKKHVDHTKTLTHCYVCGHEATETNKLVANHDHLFAFN